MSTWSKYGQVIFHNGALVTSTTILNRILTSVEFITTIFPVHIPTSMWSSETALELHYP
jgi:hypothetical protein